MTAMQIATFIQWWATKLAFDTSNMRIIRNWYYMYS